MNYVAEWARAFAVTAGVELCVATPLLGRPSDGPPPPLWRRIGAVVFAQVASHPAVWFVFPELGLPYSVSLTLSEIWALASEILIYRLVFESGGWSRAVTASAIANAVSFGVGLILNRLW